MLSELLRVLCAEVRSTIWVFYMALVRKAVNCAIDGVGVYSPQQNFVKEDSRLFWFWSTLYAATSVESATSSSFRGSV